MITKLTFKDVLGLEIQRHRDGWTVLCSTLAFSIAQESSPGGPKAFGHLMSALDSSGNVTSKRGEVPKNGVQRFLVSVDSANTDLKPKAYLRRRFRVSAAVKLSWQDACLNTHKALCWIPGTAQNRHGGTWPVIADVVAHSL